ncbi:uncharacterized protein [Amphiura filiformis]|uniref:uncharacterized protein n=1 Tax=Amphiura filiformis TaxID=82378 RepID=UPI003B20B82D
MLLNHSADVNAETKDGYTALHCATLKDHTNACEILLKYNANVNAQDKDGYSALHFAAFRSHPGICEMLLKYNADVNAETKTHGTTALYLAALNGHTETCYILLEHNASVNARIKNVGNPVFLAVYDSVQKAIQRKKYKELMETGTTPVQMVKLFVCGAPAAGKTTLKNSLTRDLEECTICIQDSANDTNPLPYIPTAGIDISKHEIKDIGIFRIWDLAGHVEYHISHAMFLGAENSVFIVVYNLIKESHAKDLRYWLCFLKSGHSTMQPTKPQVVIVASHMDQVDDKKTGYRVAQRHLEEMRCMFEETLDIADIVVTINACNATDQGFEVLKQMLKKMAANMLGSRMLPTICQRIMDQCRKWYNPKYPVVPWSYFFDRVKEIAICHQFQLHNLTPTHITEKISTLTQDIDSMIEEDTVKLAASYLHDMGEIYIAKEDSEICEAMVIMDIQWLCAKVIAEVLAGDEFPAEFQKLPDKPVYSKSELPNFLATGKGLKFEFTVLLLEHLKLVFTTDDGNYLIPSKLQPSLPPILIQKSAKAHIYGIRVECADESDMFSPDLFPNIHLHMLESHPESQGKANYSISAIKCVVPIKSMLQLTDMERAINIAVLCNNEVDKPVAHSQLQSLKRITQMYLRHRSPGTVVTWKFLSPKSLKTECNLEKVLYYELDDLHKAEKGNGTVYHSQLAHTDDMTDVICQGVDMTFIAELGGCSGWEWISTWLQQRICAVLDETHPLGSDYRMLADIWGIPWCKFQQLARFCSTTKGHSITDEILKEVCSIRRRNADKLTIQKVLTVLKHPSMIGNDDLAKSIESMLLDSGHQVEDKLPDKYGVPDLTLLWRAVLKRTHQSLKRTIKPSELLLYLVGEGSLLSDDDQDEIETKEKLEGRRKAVDLLLFKLMHLTKPDWHESFVAGLQQEAPTLVPIVTEARDELLQERWFASIPVMSSPQGQNVTDLVPERSLNQADIVCKRQNLEIVARNREILQFNPEELVPVRMPVTEKLKILDSFKAILNLPNVRERLISITTEEILDYFPCMSSHTKDEIRQQFTIHGQHVGAEYFLERLPIMGTSWPQHLMQALQGQRHYDYMQYLFEEYQAYLQQHEDQSGAEDNKAPQSEVPIKPQKSAQEVACELHHLFIWDKVVDLKMVMLREIASESIFRTLSSHMPEFVQMYKRECTARKSSDGETRAVRWIMERLQKSKDLRWPGALQSILQCNDALLDDARREFWKIHEEGCPCIAVLSKRPDAKLKPSGSK